MRGEGFHGCEGTDRPGSMPNIKNRYIYNLWARRHRIYRDDIRGQASTTYARVPAISLLAGAGGTASARLSAATGSLPA